MSVWPWRDHLKPVEKPAIAAFDAELATLLDRIQYVRDRRNRIVNRAILRAREAARKQRNVSRERNSEHANGVS